MQLGPILESLLRGDELTPDTAGEIMGALMDGEATEVQISSFLVAMRAKGATGRELAAFASAMRERALHLTTRHDDLVDTCGTGGGIPSFNLSTAAAFVACAAGARVAKHGNRAMSSKCGSADVIETLGAKLTDDPPSLVRLLETVKIAFLFAQTHHPAMRHVGPVRKALGIRTVFNQIGPLANPAGAKRQVIGVYDESIGPAMAAAAMELGNERVWVVRGRDGLDEISPHSPTTVWDGDREFLVSPDDFGLDAVPEEALLPGETLQENASILREAISDTTSMRFAAILPSSAAVLHIAGVAGNLRQGADMVRKAVASGAARAKLEEFVGATNKT